MITMSSNYQWPHSKQRNTLFSTIVINTFGVFDPKNNQHYQDKEHVLGFSNVIAVLHRLKNSEAVYPACRKRRLLGTYQLQSDC